LKSLLVVSIASGKMVIGHIQRLRKDARWGESGAATY
jgi:hypothetical protein